MSEQTIPAGRSDADLVWVSSMGGPLVVVPVSALDCWGRCTEDSLILDGPRRDDYTRACEVEEYAGVGEASALVLGQEPATTCYLPERRIFVRWLAADSDGELFEAVEALLADPDTDWEDGGTWTTDGDAILMDSAEAGTDLGVEYPTGGGFPDQVAVPIPAGRWRVRAVHTGGEFPWSGWSSSCQFRERGGG